jgi:hypothetical protein
MFILQLRARIVDEDAHKAPTGALQGAFSDQVQQACAEVGQQAREIHPGHTQRKVDLIQVVGTPMLQVINLGGLLQESKT